MKKTLLKHIICPFCKSRFTVNSFDKPKALDSVEEGYLRCSCRSYPIINGVPRILPDKFLKQILDEHYSWFIQKHKDKLPVLVKSMVHDSFYNKKKKTQKGFGYEWRKFPEMHDVYKSQFLDWIMPVDKDFFKGKLVLDAGCGTGRHVAFSTEWGAETIGIDLSEAVDVAFKNTKHHKKTHIIQADIYNLPFKQETFDYIFSIGVLHHLPRPEQGFDQLVKYLKPKKKVSIWVYGREKNFLLMLANPIRKYVLSKLPLPFLYSSALIFAGFLYPVCKLIYRPIGKFSPNLLKLLPQGSFFSYLGSLNFRIVHSIIFDQMLAPVAFYYKRSEVLSWFRNSDVKVLSISWRNRNSWRVFGEKAAD